jgi:murein DD-endopeptidase MepM/ murein hydrolase activator NlpD
LTLIGSLVYYYLNAYKIVYYDDLRIKYDQLVQDNRRIQAIEREYRKIRQENEKIRIVFGLLGDSLRDETAVQTVSSASFSTNSDLTLAAGRLPNTGIDQESRFAIQDYAMYARVVPSVMPVNSRFVGRGFNLAYQGTYHPGIDIVAVEGSPVKSAADGWVVLSDWLTDFGNTIILYHGYGFFTVYKHLEVTLCKEGSFVKGGDIMATLGRTGMTATGAHLHFEVWKDGVPEDPGEYIYQLHEALSVSIKDSLSN